MGSQVAEPAKMEDYFASLVKAGIVGTAFFSKLVPHTVHISISLYSSKKDATIKAIRSKIDENIALVHA